MPAASNFITFLVDGQLFGVPATEVMELARFHELTRVPLAPSAVAGLMNLRGQVVTAVEMPGVDTAAVRRVAESAGAKFRARPHLDDYES